MPSWDLTQTKRSFLAGPFEFAHQQTFLQLKDVFFKYKSHDAIPVWPPSRGPALQIKPKLLLARKAESKKWSTLLTASHASLLWVYHPPSVTSDCREPLVQSSSLCLEYSDLRVIGRESPFSSSVLASFSSSVLASFNSSVLASDVASAAAYASNFQPSSPTLDSENGVCSLFLVSVSLWRKSFQKQVSYVSFLTLCSQCLG